MKILSKKNTSIAPSITLAITAKAKKMKQEGVDVISFGAGEPDFKTPSYIRDYANEIIEKGEIGYTPASGILELKEAICEKLLKDNQLDYQPSQIVVSNGAKHSLFNTLQVLCNKGDEVIIPSPYWVSYYELTKLADAVPVIVEGKEENQFKVDVKDLEKVVTEHTKAILLNSPNNPTGLVYSKEELQVIGDFCEKHDLYIISDEIYEKLVYGQQHVSIASLSEAIKERTIVVNGMSKAYAMTGWRIGYTASSVEIAKAMGNIQSHATSNPNTIAQHASLKALTGDQEPIENMRQAFEKRRDYMVERINSIEDLSCVKPQGAFYVMINISKIKGQRGIESSLDFAEMLLENQKVAVIPGSAFGADDFVRLSYATSREHIEQGLNRIEVFVKNLNN